MFRSMLFTALVGLGLTTGGATESLAQVRPQQKQVKPVQIQPNLKPPVLRGAQMLPSNPAAHPQYGRIGVGYPPSGWDVRPVPPIYPPWGWDMRPVPPIYPPWGWNVRPIPPIYPPWGREVGPIPLPLPVNPWQRGMQPLPLPYPGIFPGR
jgi:hypothetical protein